LSLVDSEVHDDILCMKSSTLSNLVFLPLHQVILARLLSVEYGSVADLGEAATSACGLRGMVGDAATLSNFSGTEKKGLL
jgi:hypothetical protein